MDDAKRETVFRTCESITRRLVPALAQLESTASLLQQPPLAGREWFEVLRQKLVPQLGEQAFLVVAVVGGTNIGKSVIFNHLAGCKASASSPLLGEERASHSAAVGREGTREAASRVYPRRPPAEGLGRGLHGGCPARA